MTNTATAANDNTADTFPQGFGAIPVKSGRLFPTRLVVRVLHEEVLALTGLAAVFYDAGCRVITGDIDGAAWERPPEYAPDICVLGNLDSCDAAFIKRLRQNWPMTRIVLFDLGIMDDSDFRDCGPTCRWLGLDDCLPAYSCKHSLHTGVQRIIAKCVNRHDGAPGRVERLS